MSELSNNVRVGLIGAGRMGSFHAESLAWRVPGAVLAAVADPMPGAAPDLAARLGVAKAYGDLQNLLDDPEIDAVVIAAPARTHAEWVIAAAQAGKHVFCEKPMAITLEEADRAIAAAERAGVVLQVGFNRRFVGGFAAAIAAIESGENGVTQLSRSVTRDPQLRDPTPIPPWTIFLETLIHDFDTLLHFNPGSRPVEVYALADALVRPDFKARGLLDTAVVTIRFDNGAIATAEASFQAVYGYDVRGEVFGSKGMLQAGNINLNNCVRYHAGGIAIDTSRQDTDLLREAYAAELAAFARCIRQGERPRATGQDARNALEIALACIESVQQGSPVRLGGR
ncbi:Gfo/Idh/MocA family oxidoreductase [Serratia ficaria]|uniref:Inositol 2-dehydrogenase n=1 Tax=Serratia ficaria TaxID=61651 RepID=A0A240C1L2_SERFI|nr:Gfo/Idh/MocA family oxidoreductase [Serratia ficaria]MEE4482266.1 Gfo/Idh/MocA family oxidoreductase [Serratia ficaria]REF44750.1 myo-inositol 2-dehydrogenase/D-chiro-inositol 1-dehydrogenase [Serratia ficaria]CAI0696572.1 Inositol 2-dehydrogenase [Serratia ficaria]CAI0812182.1 Inositol 2-dehydrogenase [Serratia ficaria]CAI0818708.1 Inositol 2-dehydrogenase [Serratia ficaria]